MAFDKSGNSPDRWDEIRQVQKIHHEKYSLIVRGLAVVVFVAIGSGFFMDQQDGFIMNVFTEFASIMATFLILDYVYDSQKRTQYIRNLTLLVGTRSNALTTGALRELHHEGLLQAGVLRKVVLRRADLRYNNLRQADFRGADLWRTDFRHTNLAQATFQKTHLKQTQFEGSYMQGANFSGTLLEEIDWTNAHLTATNFEGATFKKVTLVGAWLDHANLKGVSLKKINLKRANLSYADLTGANLTGANLAGANLSGANLTGAILSNVQWYADDGSDPAILPDRSQCIKGRDMKLFTGSEPERLSD